ncbi:MAG: T9SS type A sorting domain-containing protein [Weeksellaceae bacterium]|nr:T9SS type A sorting domain-containing protein [Weeksellaceae bacterium]
MKKIFTLLSVAAFSATFAQTQIINTNETLTSAVIQPITTSGVATETATYSQVSTDEIASTTGVLSCSSLTSPIQLSRIYDLQAEFGLNEAFTPTHIDVSGRPHAGAAVEGYLYQYNGSDFGGDLLAAEDFEELPAYGSYTSSTNQDAQWVQVEMYDTVEIPAGTKFATSLVMIISGSANNYANSFIPWQNADATETKPAYFGGPYGTCSIDANGNWVNPKPQFDNGTYQMKVTGTFESLGTVELGGSALKAYPNPATTEINIALEGSNVSGVEITDVTGRVVSSQSVKGNKVNVANLSKGVYFLRVKDDKGVTRIQKFIKK